MVALWESISGGKPGEAKRTHHESERDNADRLKNSRSNETPALRGIPLQAFLYTGTAHSNADDDKDHAARKGISEVDKTTTSAHPTRARAEALDSFSMSR